MREHGEFLVRRTDTIATATKSFTFMLVFCFAGCAAGSCLSYGHSCWGAHGKRSGHYAGQEVRPVISSRRSNEGEPVRQQDHWILSRLVTRQLSSPSANKLQTNWYDETKISPRGPIWDSNDDVEILTGNVNAIRRDEDDVVTDDDDEDDNEIRGATVRVALPRILPEEVFEPREISDAAELVLASRSGDHLKTTDKSHKLRLIKILNGANDKLN